ncbi:MAG: hypothetical protein ACLR2E_04055 [Lachnospiraceae bacterium]
MRKKSKRANLLVDYNLSLVVYLYPAVLKYEGESGKLFPRNSALLGSSISRTPTYPRPPLEQINGGF